MFYLSIHGPLLHNGKVQHPAEILSFFNVQLRVIIISFKYHFLLITSCNNSRCVSAVRLPGIKNGSIFLLIKSPVDKLIFLRLFSIFFLEYSWIFDRSITTVRQFKTWLDDTYQVVCGIMIYILHLCRKSKRLYYK